MLNNYHLKPSIIISLVFKKEYDTVCRSDSFRVVESSLSLSLSHEVDMTENSVTNIIM